MNFRGRENQRVRGRIDRFLSAGACQTLRDGRILADEFLPENIYAPIRAQALDFFKERLITWHRGKACVSSILSSQVAAVNFLFPFIDRPKELLAVLKAFLPGTAEILPITADQRGDESAFPHVTFEWMGERNYLKEPRWGQRGKNATSVDSLFRIRHEDGEIRLLLVEWKYLESYQNAKVERVSKNGTDRLQLYSPLLSQPDSPVQPDFPLDELLVNPFYQLMRLQLLAREMERAGEMEATSASLLLIAPRANLELNTCITCKPLAGEGRTIQGTWLELVGDKRFSAIYTEDLLEVIRTRTTDRDWADYLTLRYGDMK